MTEQPASADSLPRGRASRWGLYLPFVAFGLICLAWSGYWLVARTVVLNGIEREIMAAAQRGDRWSCEGQTVRGFPFRIEVRCADVRLARQASAGVVAFSSGPVVAIGQPTTPNHIIIHGQGPATARLADGTMVEARWELFEASRRISRGELERFSADLRRPTLTVRPPQGDAVTLSSQQTELYVRRNPERPAEQKAVDVFLKATQLASAHLDTVFGDPNPSNLEVQLTVDRADVLSRGLTPAVLEQWRQQDGKADLTRLALIKGVKRVEGTGSFALDAERRLVGRIEPSVANIDQVAGIRLRGGAMDFMSALANRGGPSADGLRPLPAIEAREGRVMFGPIRLPVVRLDPLY